ncbi:MAG TPA: fused MFS/spermidine synthase, partial [Desulfopila sp.]|nr:fused MFS/spermidine synthase [Desulfopila sp.]
MTEPEKNLLYSYREKNSMEVVDEGKYRSLYFQGDVVQSRMCLKDPGRLVLRYTQYMMAAALLARPRPSRVLLIGIGAGSLLQFFERFLPSCHIDAVDYSENIIRVARGYFLLPENDCIRIHCDDGLHYLKNLAHERLFDLILVDAFTDTGMARTVYSSEFFKTTRSRLTPDGVICSNLWSGNQAVYKSVRKAMTKHFAGSLFIPVRKRENRIALLFQENVPWKKICPSPQNLEALART